jgi:hypothetical protein
MVFTGNEEHGITLSAAAAMTKNYRDVMPTGAIISHYFGKAAIQDILDQDNCVGLRLYYGLDDGIQQIIVVGVNSAGNDLYEGLLAERSVKCPYECPAANPLNTNVTS